MKDIVELLRNGNLTISGEVKDINKLLTLHQEAADEIERLRERHFVIDEKIRNAALEEATKVIDSLWDKAIDEKRDLKVVEIFDAIRNLKT